MYFIKTKSKKKIIFCMLALLLTGCAAGSSANTDTETGTEGVYYPEIPRKNLSAIYREMACYAYTSLGYNDVVYTSFYCNSLPDRSEIPVDSIAGRELAQAYGNHEVYWSVDEADLSDNTLTAIIYSVNGYEEDFRVCIYYEKTWPETIYGLQIFEKLNGITLYKGSELFRDRLHLDRAAEVYDADHHPISMEDASMKAFMEVLFDGEFIDADSELQSLLEYAEAKSIYFEDEIGLVTELKICPEGYAFIKRLETLYVVQIDPEICRKMVYP